VVESASEIDDGPRQQQFNSLKYWVWGGGGVCVDVR